MALFSKILTLNTTCQEYVHPWTASCANAYYSLMFDVAGESLRIYVTAYLIALLMRGRVPTKQDILRTCLGILQSTIFLTSHGIGYSIALCSLRKLLGSFNFLTVSFLPSFLSSIVAILIERPSRRALLSLYVTNVASETLFRMAVWRNWVKPIRYGEVAIFSASISMLLYFFKSDHVAKDPIFTLLRFLVGPYEEHPVPEKKSEDITPHLRKYNGKSLFLKGFVELQNWWKNLIFKIKSASTFQFCPHPSSCLYYTLQGGGKMFLAGYVLQFCFKIVFQMNKILKDPKVLREIPFQLDTLQLGAFLSTFSMIYRVSLCLLRRWEGRDSKHLAIPAGLIAGISFFFYRGNTIALYFMWKTFQLIYNKGVEEGYLVNVPWASVFFHAFSTAILFHCAILEPHNLRPSYWKFLIAVSGGRIAKMDRKCIDSFGLESSKSLASVLERQKMHK